MKSSQILVETLKQALKTRRINYKALAQVWQLSEASVKRIMSQGDLNLERIEQACELMQMSFGDLIRLTPFQAETLDQELSLEHEAEFVNEPKLFHFWMLLSEGKTVKWIEKKFDVTPAEIQKFVSALDRIKLIELHPGNKVRILAKNRVRFRKDGQMGKRIVTHAKDSFLNAEFKNSDEHLRFGMYRLNTQSVVRYKTKMDKLIHEMKSESEIEGEQSDSVEFGFLLALRPWTSPLLTAMKPRGKFG
jgi:DNA-binding Xre family transcriptional regulator